MKKYTQKELKSFIRLGIAENVTDWAELLPCYEKLGYSVGIYGMNGGLYKDKEGRQYVIIGRSSNFFRIF